MKIEAEIKFIGEAATRLNFPLKPPIRLSCKTAEMRWSTVGEFCFKDLECVVYGEANPAIVELLDFPSIEDHFSVNKTCELVRGDRVYGTCKVLRVIKGPAH